MNRTRTLLASLSLLLALSSATVALAATGAARSPLPLHAAAAVAADTHTGDRAGGRAHGRCKPASGKRHRKHARRCARAHRTGTGGSAGAASRAGRRSTPAPTPKRSPGHARHTGAGSLVTVGVPSPSATIASVLATPCTDTELMPEAANLAQVEAATLCLVNQERARNNELPLQPNAKLAQSSQMHSEQMVGENYFSHIAPDGETPLQRIEATGYIPNAQVGYTIGENIAWGTLSLATPSAIVAAWIASPEHLANILNGEYRDTAVGVDPAAPASLAEGQPGAVYTQEFGVIDGS